MPRGGRGLVGGHALPAIVYPHEHPLELGDALLEALDGCLEVVDRVVERVGQELAVLHVLALANDLVDCSEAVVVDDGEPLARRGAHAHAAAGDHVAGDPHDRAVGRDVTHHNGATAHLDVVAEGHVAEHRRAHAHHHVVAEGGVALAALLAGAPEGDALVELAVVADDGGLAHDDAHAVVDHEAPADGGAGVNLDAEAVAAPRGERARDERMPVRPPPVLAAVGPDGAHAGRVEQDGDG